MLFKLSILQDAGDDYFPCFCPKLVYLSLEALIKTQNDEVRMNCIGLSPSKVLKIMSLEHTV